MLRAVTILLALGLAKADLITRSGEFNRYYLYNRLVSGVQVDFLTGNANIIAGVPTVVIVHGHQGTYLTSLNPEVRRELLESDNVNVISVDWSIYASMSYTLAENAVLSVGEHLATFLTNQGIAPANLHLVGFNLGAHIVGVAGRRLNGVARITGLDPSRSAIRLTRTDAGYVEVIHTDSSGFSSNGLGTQLGHADFFPNGGGNQPGCWGRHECSHNRAWQFFAASIRDNTFNANCCNTMLQKDLNLCRGVFLNMGTNALGKTPYSHRLFISTVAPTGEQKYDSPHCDECGVIDDLQHILMECVKYRYGRESLLRQFKLNPLDVGLAQADHFI